MKIQEALGDLSALYSPAGINTYCGWLNRDPQEVSTVLRRLLVKEREVKLFSKWKAAQDAYLARLETMLTVYTAGEMKQAWEMLAEIDILNNTLAKAQDAWEHAQDAMSVEDLTAIAEELRSRTEKYRRIVSKSKRVIDLLRHAPTIIQKAKST